MQTPSSFNPQFYNRLKLFINLQRDLSRLDNTNVTEIGNQILNLTEIIESKDGVLLLAQCFNDMADFLPQNIESLVDLFIFLHKSQSSSNFLHLLKENVITCIHTRDMLRSSVLFFLRMLYLRKIITIDSIIDEIKQMPLFLSESNKKSKTKNKEEEEEEEENQDDNNIENENIQILPNQQNNDKKILYHKMYRAVKWFYPEIVKSNDRFISILKNEFYFDIPKIFKTNDIETVLMMMNTGYCLSQIAKIIRDDDIDSFLQIASSEGSDFDVNQQIKSCEFERCSIISHNPTLIQYAAFFNSIKIFKYLYLNNGYLENVNDSIYPLSHFAICGGSFEIVRLLVQKNFEFCNAIPISIKYYQNDIFSWILENYPPKSRKDFVKMDRIQIFLKSYRYNFSSHFNINYDHDDYDDLENNFICDGAKYDYKKNVYDEIIDEIDDEDNDDLFKYFNFNIVFQTILESNNFLALFILFNHGMDINSKDSKSKKTLLHYSIQKGKSFLFNLLLSNKFIDYNSRDSDDQSPIIYSVRFGREKMFQKMIKIKEISDSLTNSDFILIYHYAIQYNFVNIQKYILSIWKLDLFSLMEADEIKSFCNAMTFLPFSLYKDQVENVLTESFKTRKYDYFSILGSRALKEVSSYFKGLFFCVFQQKNKKEVDKAFIEICHLFFYYCITDYYGHIDYYKKFEENRNHAESSKISFQSNYYLYKKIKFTFNENYFLIKEKDNEVTIQVDKDSNVTQFCQIKMELQNNQNNDKKPKKKKANNKPTIYLDNDDYN